MDLIFLPPYSPELAPAERGWRILDEVVVNQSFATVDALETVLVRRCRHLMWYQRRQIKSLTRYHWWPRARRLRSAQ